MSGTDVRDSIHSPLGRYHSTLWSTEVDLVVTDHHLVVAAAQLFDAITSSVEMVASRFLPDSEIRGLQRDARTGKPVHVSADLLELLSVAMRAATLTGGCVDPTVGNAMCRVGYDRDFSKVADRAPEDLPLPNPVVGWSAIALDTERSTVTMPAGLLLDLGATAKAWAVDRAASSIAARLGCGVLVSVGGDIAVGGEAPIGGFAIGVADVCGDFSTPVTVAIESGGMATSGVGNRHWMVGNQPVHHLIDPATSLPVETCWRTVSVAAGSCLDANTASTAAMIMGEPATEWLGDRCLPSRLVRTDGSLSFVGAWPIDQQHHLSAAPLGELAQR
jgi:thiamine biosynthesis lipoprotein